MFQVGYKGETASENLFPTYFMRKTPCPCASGRPGWEHLPLPPERVGGMLRG